MERPASLSKLEYYEANFIYKTSQNFKFHFNRFDDACLCQSPIDLVLSIVYCKISLKYELLVTTMRIYNFSVYLIFNFDIYSTGFHVVKVFCWSSCSRCIYYLTIETPDLVDCGSSLFYLTLIKWAFSSTMGLSRTLESKPFHWINPHSGIAYNYYEFTDNIFVIITPKPGAKFFVKPSPEDKQKIST